MNSIEEQLWNYIDGTCTPGEQQAISMLIETDENYRRQYEELLALNAEFANIELEEPPMAFTYRVMEPYAPKKPWCRLKHLSIKILYAGCSVCSPLLLHQCSYTPCLLLTGAPVAAMQPVLVYRMLNCL
jgi:anti-sigma factor RsiW